VTRDKDIRIIKVGKIRLKRGFNNMGRIREAKTLCPIFREDNERVDLGDAYLDITAGTVTASTLGSDISGSFVLNSGTVEVELPLITNTWATATADATVAGIAVGDIVIVTPLRSLPAFAQFSAAEPGAGKIVLEFYNSSGSSVDGSAAAEGARMFTWRKWNS